MGFISTVKEVGILAFRSFLIFSDDQATPLWKSLLLLSICFGSQPQEFLSRVHSSPVSLASEKRLFFEGLRNVFPVTHYWYERLGWFAFMLKNEGRGSTSGSLMVWLFCSGVVCGSVHVYWRSSALLQESVCSNQREREQTFLLLVVWAQTCPLLPSSQYVGDNSWTVSQFSEL